MEHQRIVKRERSHLFAAENGFHNHDVSARTGESVSFYELDYEYMPAC
jgi:Ras-related protein Rab-28